MKKSYIVPAEKVREVCFSEICATSSTMPDWDAEGGDINFGGDMEEGDGGAVKKQHSAWDDEW